MLNAGLSPSPHEHYMCLAIAEAQKAALLGEVPVGAVLVFQDQVIATAGNAPISTCDPSGHAEMRVLRQAATALQNYRLPDTQLYVTLEPCLMCAGAIFHARVAHLIFGASDPKTGVAGSVMNIFENTHLNHHTKVTEGVLALECGQLLSDFFKARRASHSLPLSGGG